MPISNVANYSFLLNMTKLRGQASRLQEQLGSGLKAHTYGGLGTQRTTTLAMRARLSHVEAFDANVATIQLRIKLLDATLTRLDKIPRDIKGSLDPNAYEPRSDGYTDIQRSAAIALDETLQLLNAEVDGRYLYAGAKSDAPPVASMREILDGSGSKAGLRQLIGERRAADLGLNDGGLDATLAADTVTLGWDPDAGADFGFRVTGATGGASSSVATADDGLPTETAAITFTAVPPPGETVTVDLVDSTGKTTSITLTAAMAPAGAGAFEIGADVNATAANFLRALQTAVSAAADADTSGVVGGEVLGRLATTVTGSAVALGKADPANDEFGFTVAGATATGAIGIASAGQGTPQESVTFDFTGPLAGGETVQLTLRNPDGTSSVVSLKGVKGPEVGPAEFLIDADPAVTAANFDRSLRNAISDAAKRDLWAASAVRASTDFFDTTSGFARRIDLATGGGNPAFATGYLPEGTDTSATTVQWYTGQNDPVVTGDLSTQPRQDVTGRIDKDLDVAYGARANEKGLRSVVQHLAMLVAETFPPNTGGPADKLPREQYAAFAERARAGLTYRAGEGPEDVHAQIAVAGQMVENIRQRHITSKSMIQGAITDIEGVDKDKAAAELLTLTNALEASYAVTSRLSQLTLVNYLR